jgi:pimeloyl-ACP methyl ester carboxylesterase
VRTLAGLAVDEIGDRSDPRATLVLLHGLTFDRSMWKPALVELAALDPHRRALAFDLPGHGASEEWTSYDVESVAAGVHRAVEEAGVERPVIVGHSLAAIVATVYAGTFPTRGVVNVDQSLQTAPFVGFLQSIAEQLRGPAFPAMWEQFAASMHADLLPEAAQELLRSTSDPRQDLVLGYWREVLDRPASQILEQTSTGLAAVRAAMVPYLIIAGDEPAAEYRAWLADVLPHAEISVLPGSGHFPHLAHPIDFARALAGTATWPARDAR